MRGVTPPETEEADPVFIQEDFAPDQAMCPIAIDTNDVSQNRQRAGLSGSADKDYAAPQWRLGIERPPGRKWPARWGLRDPRGKLLAHGSDVFRGANLQGRQGLVLKPAPDVPLPAVVEAFNGRLEAGFPGRGKDGSDAQAQAEARDSAEGVWPGMGSLENRAVVELGEVGEARVAPTQNKALSGRFRGYLSLRPRVRKTSEEGNSVEDFDEGAPLDDERFDDVEGVQLRPALDEVGQIPPRRRWREAKPDAAVKGSAALQDAADRANGGQSILSTVQQGAANGRSPVLSEIALLLEILAQVEDKPFSCRRRAVERVERAVRPVAEVDPVQALSFCSIHPQTQGAGTDPILAGRYPKGSPLPDGGYHCPAPLLQAVFLFTSDLLDMLFQLSYVRGLLTLKCSGVADTCPVMIT